MKITDQKFLKSLLVGLIAIVVLGSGFIFIRRSPQEGGTPTPLRHAYMFNEKVWSLVYSTKRLSVNSPTPPMGKKPRVNGMLGLKTPLDLKNYRVLIEQPGKQVSLQVEEFSLLPKVSYSTDFRCIEGWSEETQYAGTRFSEFTEKHGFGKKANGRYYEYVGLETPDGKYYVSIDMESMLHPQTVLAYEMNLSPLSVDNGAPIRLIIPIKYGIKSLKRIGRIFFSDERPKDYWAERGYDWYSGL